MTVRSFRLQAEVRDPATWIVAAAVAVFAAYAASFLYFFVDDEAIPLVYARNLLRGHGLVYTTVEGRVEGYSDFLHVLWQTASLAFARALHLTLLTPVDIGKSVSFASGILIVLLVARTLRRAGATNAGLAAALSCVALAGPLAVWSCSSLEAVPFALVVAALASALFTDGAPRAASIALGAILVLYRIDGFVYAGAVLLAAVACAAPGTRARLVTRVAAPILAIAATYHAGRAVYFGSVLSAPLEAKVLYKLSPASHILVKAPERPYLRSLVDVYGLTIVPALGAAAAVAWTSRPARAFALASLLIGVYIAVVGDWMFGWRFAAPIVPLVAFVVGVAVSRLRPPLAIAAVCVTLVWTGAAARTFARHYVASENRPLWWGAAHLGEAVWLAPYGDLIATARHAVTHGQTIAYNQAGLVPFLLDVENVDDLGICSRFEAALPTTDVFFTEVGRYSPLTDAPVVGAAQAYLLYRDVRLLISRTDLLTNANHGRVPQEVLGGYFRLLQLDPSGENALYERTPKDADAFRKDPSLFRENLAHFSHVLRLEVDGRPVPDADVGPQVPFLRWGTGVMTVAGRRRLDIRFAKHDEDVYGLYVRALAARHGTVNLTITLYDSNGRMVAREDAQPDTLPRPMLHMFDRPVRAHALSLEASSPDNADLAITDLQVHGQSSVLGDYVRRTLKFPAP